MSEPTVARTILEQLGGNKFAVMTGAKHFIGIEEGLTFRIGRNCHAINSVDIRLNGNDLYDMTFYRIRGSKCVIAAQFSDIYADMLQELFTEATGMYTHL